MRTPRTPVLVVFIACALIVSAAPASAGRIVLNHDEWTLSNRGFAAEGGINDPGVFINKVMRWFTG